MPFEHLNRNERRAAVKYARREVEKRTVELSPLTRAEILKHYPGANPPSQAWVSRRYMVQLFDEDPFQGIDTRRMSVNRVTLGPDGRWVDGLTWDELQALKAEIGFGDWYGLEIYPRARDLVNVANLRHLWLLAHPLDLGWFSR